MWGAGCWSRVLGAGCRVLNAGVGCWVQSAGCRSGALGARGWAGDAVGAGLQSSYEEHLGCRCVLTERGLCLGTGITARCHQAEAGT